LKPPKNKKFSLWFICVWIPLHPTTLR
jgi:hypothetical protein